MLTHSVIQTMARPTAETIRAPLELLALIGRLHLDVDLQRAQEAMYAAITTRSDLPNDELGGLLDGLRMCDAPALIANRRP